MPMWTIAYQIGRECSHDDFCREQQVFCNDPRCSSYQCTDSADYRGRILVQVVFHEAPSRDSLQILQLREATAVPAVPRTPLSAVLQVEEFSNITSRSHDEELNVTRIQVERRPLPITDPRVWAAHQQILAEEDARVFEILNAIASSGTLEQQPKVSKPAPEPRPPFKTRYERIMSAFNGK